MNSRYISLENVLRIHTTLIKKAGTRASLSDFSLLHSAIERPKATYLGKSLYPSLFLKAAALLHSLCLNHPFTDGNKRAAWAATKLFLFLNDQILAVSPNRATKFLLALANNQLTLAKIAHWLKSNSSPTNPS